MKNRFFFSLKPVLVSCVIGAAVSLLFNLAFGDPWVATALKGALAGTIIGSFAEGSFIATARWINKKPVLSFAAVILVIAAGTIGFVRLFMTASIPGLFAVVAVSEIAGITATALFWRYSKKMNDRLEKTKKHFTA